MTYQRRYYDHAHRSIRDPHDKLQPHIRFDPAELMDCYYYHDHYFSVLLQALSL